MDARATLDVNIQRVKNETINYIMTSSHLQIQAYTSN